MSKKINLDIKNFHKSITMLSFFHQHFLFIQIIFIPKITKKNCPRLFMKLEQQQNQQVQEKKFILNKKYTVYLTPDGKNQRNLEIIDNKLCFVEKQKMSSILLNDLIGLKQNKHNQYIKVVLNGYPRVKKFLRSEKRYIETMGIFYLEQKNKQLINELISIITNRQSNHNLLLFLNPAAGSNSKKHFENVIDFLSYTNFTYDIVKTTKRGHCQQYLANNQLTNYCAIVIISGDGLMHQYLNVNCKLPVTHVPAGSGNAFSKSQTQQAGQLCQDYQSIYLLVKGRKFNFNVVKFQLAKIEKPIYSFLSFEWAILADIDINSEFLRFLGGLRFEVYAVKCLLKLKRYRAKITYSTVTAQLPPLNIQINKDDTRYEVFDEPLLFILASHIPWISDKYHFAPGLKVKDQAMDLQIVTQKSGRWQMTKFLLNSDSGSHFDQTGQNPKEGYEFIHKKIKCFRIQPYEQYEIGVFGIDGESYEAQKIQGSICNRKLTTFT